MFGGENDILNSVFKHAYTGKYNNYPIVIAGVYRSPRRQEEEFCNIFKKIEEELIEKTKTLS